MARRTVTPELILWIYRQAYGGQAIDQVAEELGLDRATVARYLAGQVIDRDQFGYGPRRKCDDCGRLVVSHCFPCLIAGGCGLVDVPAVRVLFYHDLRYRNGKAIARSKDGDAYLVQLSTSTDRNLDNATQWIDEEFVEVFSREPAEELLA